MLYFYVSGLLCSEMIAFYKMADQCYFCGAQLDDELWYLENIVFVYSWEESD